jgi:hypothetical protein
MKKKLFIIILILFAILLSGCATQQYAQVHRKKKTLMLLKNTELDRNIKYYKQRHTRYNKSNYNKHLKNFKK